MKFTMGIRYAGSDWAGQNKGLRPELKWVVIVEMIVRPP